MILLGVLLIFLALSTTSVAPYPPPHTEAATDAVVQAVENGGTGLHAISSLFPPKDLVARSRYMGRIPPSLNPLIQSATPSGRLIFHAPPPSHALMMTTSDLSSIRSILPVRPRVFAVGVVTSSSGQVSYFRSLESFTVETPRNHHRSNAEPTWITPHENGWQLTVPPFDYDTRPFGPRKIALALPDGTIYNSQSKVYLSHVTVRPIGMPPILGTKWVLPSEIRAEVLQGRPPWPLATRADGLVEWDDEPNWSEEERVANALARQNLSQ